MRRLTSLDGLRGAAALTVLLHHGLLLFPVLAEPYFARVPAPSGTAAWWAVHTPLHLLWEGKAGVYVFFVLSGFVLTLPAMRDGHRWDAYYPSRLIRLYLPIWGAVAFAAVTFLLVDRVGIQDSPWLDERPRSLTAMMLVRDVTLVGGNGGIASPLWSLTWEILFSLALPIVLWVAIRVRRLHAVIMVAAVALSSVGGAIEETAVMYPPMFVVGVILALRREEVSRWCERIPKVGWWLGLILAVVLLTSRWTLMSFQTPHALVGATVGLMLVGAVFCVVAALEWPRAKRTLDAKPFQLLGTLSFSLYLVHEPIIVATGFALPDAPALALIVAVGITAVVTPVFYLAVEKPSHKLAKRVSKLVRQRSIGNAVASSHR